MQKSGDIYGGKETESTPKQGYTSFMQKAWVRFKNSGPMFLVSLIGAFVSSFIFLVLGLGLFVVVTFHLHDGQAWLYLLASFGAFSVADRCLRYVRQEIGPFKNDVTRVDVAPLAQAADFQRIRSRWKTDSPDGGLE